MNKNTNVVYPTYFDFVPIRYMQFWSGGVVRYGKIDRNYSYDMYSGQTFLDRNFLYTLSDLRWNSVSNLVFYNMQQIYEHLTNKMSGTPKCYYHIFGEGMISCLSQYGELRVNNKQFKVKFNYIAE